MTRNIVRKFAPVGIATVLIAASSCSSSDSGSDTNGKITLTYMNIYISDPGKSIVNDVIKKFEAAHPNITVKNTPVDTSVQTAKYKTLLASGTPPDLAELDSSITSDLINKKTVVPVDAKAAGYTSKDDLESAYIGGVLDGYRDADKTLYALPEEYSNYQPWVNTKAFDDAGVSVPTTWDQVCDIGPKLLKKDAQGRVVQQAIALPNDPGVQYTFLESFVRSFGTPMFSGPGFTKSNLTSKSVVAAFTMLQHLVYDCQATFPSLTPAASAGGDRATFPSGLTAMLLTAGSWMTGLLKPPIVPPLAKVYPYPAGPAGIGNAAYGYGYVVAKASKHQKEAWQFARALSDAGVTFLAKAGLFNGRKDVADSPEAAKTPYWTTNWVPSLAKSKYSAPYATQQIGSIVADVMSQVTLQHADVSKALAQADAKIKPLLAKQK